MMKEKSGQRFVEDLLPKSLSWSARYLPAEALSLCRLFLPSSTNSAYIATRRNA